MKRILIGILALIMVLGLVGCSSTPADGINTAEPAENPIEVTEDIVVTYNEFIKKCDEARVLPGLDYSKVLRLIENEDGFSFRRDGDEREEKTIFGNTDKDKNLTNVTIVCNGVEVSWIQDKEAIKNFYERFMNTDFTSMHGPTLSAMSDTYAAIDMVEMVYELISNKVGTLDAAIEILTSDSPVQVGKWSVSAVLDKDNYTVTIVLEQSRRKNQKNDTSRVGKDGLLLQEDIQIENQKFAGIMWEEKTFEKGGKAKFHRIIPPLNGRGA